MGFSFAASITCLLVLKVETEPVASRDIPLCDSNNVSFAVVH